MIPPFNENGWLPDLIHDCALEETTHVLMPMSARKQLNDLPDDVLTKVTLFCYSDPWGRVDKGIGGVEKLDASRVEVENLFA